MDRAFPIIEVRQQDWMPGFAAYLSGAEPQGPAHILINLGGLLSTVKTGGISPSDLPYFLAESIMHEIVHALEEWAAVEFNEDRVELLIHKYNDYIRSSS